jgi:hypothetical protein
MNRLVVLLVALLFSRVLCEGVPLRKLQAHGNDQNGGGVGHTELRSEKMSDAALATQQAILKTFDKGGSTKKATGFAVKMTAAATDLSVNHREQHDLEQRGRRLAAANIGAYGSETTGLDTAMAASNAIAKAVQTPSKGSAKFATDVGTMTGRLATLRPTPAQVDTAAGLPLRRLLAHGGNTHAGGAQATELRSEKLSDSMLGTREAIFKVSERGSVNKATAIGTKMTAAATDPTVSHREEQMIEAGKPKRLATRRLMML